LQNETNWVPLPQDAEIENDSTEKGFSNSQREISISTVVLPTVSFYQSGLYACYIAELEFNFDEIQLHVGRKWIRKLCS